jgi:UDP-GlcNAc:undecaprenyl-phosphate/decaprenyl-phosphate GlcNAc-1-phosphate transferase
MAAATTLPRRDRLAVLSVIVGLTAASEYVSFSRVIDRAGPLRWLDMLGRRPAEPGRPEQAKPEVDGAGAASQQRDGQADGTVRLAQVP